MTDLIAQGTGGVADMSTSDGAATWPSPDAAVQVLGIDAVGTDYGAWLAARRAAITSSDVMAIMGLLPYRSAYEVWLDKTGRLPLLADTHLLERGRRLEPACAQWLSDRTELTLHRTGTWRSAARPWMLANPDRFIADRRAGAEFKVVDEDWTGLWDGGCADYAQGQAQWCAAVTGADEWYVGALLLGKRDFVVYRIEHDPAITERMALYAWQWHARYVRGDERPPVDGSEATTDALRRAYAEPTCVEVHTEGMTDLLDRRKALKARIKAAETDLRLVENQIKATLGEAEYAVDGGRRVCAWRPVTSTRVDTEMVRAEFPEALYATTTRVMRDLRK